MDDLIRQLAEKPETVCLWPEVRNPRFHNHYLQHCRRVIDSNPVEGQVVARLAIRIAPGVCDAVQAWGVYAAALRVQGKLGAAEAALRQALFIAGGCSACLADLDRREAYIKRDLKLYPTALGLANSSIERYRLLPGQATHDLDGNGLASAFLCRGQIHWEAGGADSSNRLSLFSLAAADFGKVVSMVSREDSPMLFGKAIFNLAAALFSTGREKDLHLANEHLRIARRHFKGVRKGSPERAKLDWLTAMLRYELRSMKLHRVCECLKRAQQDFIDSGMPQEAVAVTADLARLSFPDQNKIRAYILNIEDGVSRISSELRQRLRDVVAATYIENWNAPKVLRASIEALREACGPKVLACLVSWPPCM